MMVAICHISFKVFIELNLVSFILNEKPLWGVTSKVCMLACTLIRELLCVFSSLFAAKNYLNCEILLLGKNYYSN